MSVGNITQSIDFDRNDLTLVLGANLDLGGEDTGTRNGVGKTTILNALSYALFGNAVSNIKKDNLINRINEKNMLVTVEFEVNGNNYQIERGRKPAILKFYVNGTENLPAEDDAQGDSRETQKEIEHLLMMSHDLFKHIVALNTYTDPFLALKANDQRLIIEQLLGITQLSEKAEKLKELVRLTKDAVQEEEYNIKSIQETNKRILEQVASLEKRQKLWLAKKDQDILSLSTELSSLKNIDIADELKNHELLQIFHENNSKIEKLHREISLCDTLISKDAKQIEKLKLDLASIDQNICYACGGKIHDDMYDKFLQQKTTAIDEITSHTNEQQLKKKLLDDELATFGKKLVPPIVFYKKWEDAINHREKVERLSIQLENRFNENDPYDEQIAEMKETAIQTISWEKLNEINKLKEHQEFLLKLLTNKDSFIRKTIIDQNIAYLNKRLQFYLEQIGLPHTVRFQSDLTVQIEELGKDSDFHNLSRGEMSRVILSLSWAFRDVYEGLFQPINLLFIDEMVDAGVDASGVDAALAILKKMTRERNKSIFLISHKDELSSRVNNTLTITKENGFTSFNNDVEISN